MTEDEFIKNCEKLLDGGNDDPLRQMLFMMMNMLMEMEATRITGGEKGVHTKDRNDYRSGTRQRRLDTRLGTFNLEVPKFRKSGYVPFFMKYKQRSELALISMIVEAYTNGVSTRKIKHLAESLGIENISASEVSVMNKNLDGMVEEFKIRRLEKEYPVIWVDAVYEKVRVKGCVRNTAVMIIKAIDLKGKPDIIAVEVMENESEATYTELFNNLKKRGVEKVWLCVSDAHIGLQEAIRKCWVGSVWQRCKVHFMRNVTATIPKKQKDSMCAELKKIWQAQTKQEAIKLKDDFVKKHEERYPKAIDCLEEGFEDSIQYYNFSKIDSKKISSTNTLERLNKEIRRRSRVVGIFPSMEAYLRLMISSLVEYSEDHFLDTYYISGNTLLEQKIELDKEQKTA